MHALSASAPQLRQSSSVMQESLPVPSAPPMTGGPDDGTSTYPHIWQPSEGKFKRTPEMHLRSTSTSLSMSDADASWIARRLMLSFPGARLTASPCSAVETADGCIGIVGLAPPPAPAPAI